MMNNMPEDGFPVASVTPEMLDAWVRMLRLMKTPDDIPALAPGTILAQISNAIRWLGHNFAKEFLVESLAEREAMSISAFHRHFKAVTAMSPLQYQKRVRLLHARTMLLGRQKSVTYVAQEVGYRSVPQFNRDHASFSASITSENAGECCFLLG